MIKGAQKQMIVLRTSGSKLFDEAYFVLRRDLPIKKHDRTELINEANRILEESMKEPHRRMKHPRVFFFALGAFFGALPPLFFLFFPL